MTATLPSPRRNLTPAGLRDRAADVATSSTIKVAVGDFTGGASEDLFTLSSHGIADGAKLHCLWQSAMGTVTGGEGLLCWANVLSANTFQLVDTAGDVIENTADGTAVFLVGDVETDLVEIGVIPNIIVGTHDFTGGAAEDIDTPAQGTRGLTEGDTIVLLYESAAGTAGTVGTTYYAKAPTVTYFQVAATSGGAVLDTTADGTNVWLKTS